MSSFGNSVKVELFGESHAPEIGCTVTGLPRGFAVDRKSLGRFLARRAPGRNRTSTARCERDRPEFTAGLEKDRLTGGPLRVVIRNEDTRSGDYSSVVPRPGHADYGAWVKCGRIPPGGGKWSGRLTAPLCVAGGIALQILAKRGVTVTAKAASIGNETDPAKFEREILAAKADGDSTGGVVAFSIDGLPPGLGDAQFDGIDGRLAQGLFGIPAVKAVSFGAGARLAAMRGSQANDPFAVKGGKVRTVTNNCGGVLGGITTGMPVCGEVVFKPTPSIAREQASVDLSTMRNVKLVVKGRHDPCVVLRAVPVVEAVCALVALDVLLEAERDTGEVAFGKVEELADRLDGRYAKIALVSDSNVWPLHGARVKRILRKTGAQVTEFVFPAGEASKNLRTYGALMEFLAAEKLTRTDAVVALGGGVTGDMAGFAAATYLRGVDFVQVPTTLLAAVDSSVGGKTAVDLEAGKNLAGAFHFPKLTLIDTAFLATLPPREFRCGMAEAIKCRVLGGLEGSDDVEAVIRACVDLKRRIVKEDPFERGKRRLLNLGHTFGHAVEKLSGYAVPHGEAVAIGLALMARKCAERGLCDVKTARRIERMLKDAGLPVKCPYPMPDVMRAAAGDKKASGKTIRLVVPRAIGNCEVITVPRDLSDWV